jgi:chromosome segregation ATPase
MSNRGAGVREESASPKSNGRSETGDPLDAAGHHTMDLLHRAAVAAEANYQQAIGAVDKLSAQLRANEDRIRELETKVRYHHERADRAEKWLYQISMQIEQQFFGGDPSHSSQSSLPQPVPRNQPR